MKIKNLILLSIVLLTLTNCSPKKNKTACSLPNQYSQQSLYNNAMVNYNQGKYKSAASNFEFIKTTYPYTEIARQSLEKLFYIYALQKKHEQAVLIAEELMTMFPHCENMEDLRYYHAIAHYNQTTKQIRDQNAIIECAEVLEVFLEDYRNSPHYTEIEKKLAIINGKLVYHELEIGNFYEKKRNFIAALKRYLGALEISEINIYTSEILYRVYFCYYTLGLDNEAEIYYQKLAHSYPDNIWFQHAQKIKFCKVSTSKHTGPEEMIPLGSNLSQPQIK